MTDEGWTTFESQPGAPKPPELVLPDKPKRVRSGWSWAVAPAGGLAVLAWIVTAAQAASNHSSVVNDTDGASAVQISQVVDQGMSQLAPFVATSMALTVLTFVLAALSLISVEAR